MKTNGWDNQPAKVPMFFVPSPTSDDFSSSYTGPWNGQN